MHKIIIFTLSLLLLSSCFNSNSEIEDAKKELLGSTVQDQNELWESVPEVINKETPSQVNERFVVESITGTQFISITSIPDSQINDTEIEIGWETLSDNVQKIEVLFSNASSDFPDDTYTLQTFAPGSEEFRYIASTKNQVLDAWVNEYIFKAYTDSSVPSQTKVTITLWDMQQDLIWNETKLIGTEDNFINIDFPVSTKYGEPVQLGESSFTYSDIKWLEVQKRILWDVSCESVTEYLAESLSSWYYWNTCREIVKDKGIKFNVLRLDGENYVYERHYIDFKNGLYGVYELETGTGIDPDNIAEKNTEFKDKEFSTLEIVDDLMKDIVNS